MTPGLSRRRLLGALAAGGAALGAGLWPRTASAHRSHVSLTRVLANTRARSWEFLHSIHLHDVATALAAWLPGEEPDPSTDRARARVALEVERRLRWTGPDGAPLAPTMVGAELVGDGLMVYQEMAAPRAAGDYAVDCTLLHDIFEDQQNMLQFAVVTPPQTARLDAAQTRAVFGYAP